MLLIVVMGLWVAAPDVMTARERAVLACFREQPWVDPDNEALDRCLAKIPDAVWRAKR